MRAVFLALSVASLLFTVPVRAAVQYPMVLVLDAQFKSGVTTVNSKLTLRLERPMLDVVRTRVTDALKFGGYPGFVTALRPVPELGSIEAQSGKVVVRYSREEQTLTGSRLVLVADRPLFFLTTDPTKAKAGFDLTLVDLQFDGRGGVTGQLMGAARVRPSGDGGVLLDTFAEEPVQLKGTVGRP